MYYVMLAAALGLIPVAALSLLAQTRRGQRRGATACLILGGAAIAIHGHLTDRWAAVMPERSLGLTFLSMGVLALLGINVWVGSPLDPRKD